MRNRRKTAKATTKAVVSPDVAIAGDSDGIVLASALSQRWAGSRSGAVAGRGYHYQDLVGSWVALRMLAGEIDAERVIPEGFEDVTCEGGASAAIQIKSRQERVGEFRTGEVARFVVAAWRRRLDRATAGAPEITVIVVERPVDGFEGHDWTCRVNDDPAATGLAAAIRRQAQRDGIAPSDIDALLGKTTVVVLPQHRLYADAARLVADRTGLPVGVTLPAVQALRAAVAEGADRNGEVGWEERVGLSHTDIERIVTDSAALIDRVSLEEAVSNGSCEVVDFDTPLPDPDFYAGTATQPGHVTAGLVTPRPGPTDEVLAGLGTGKPVLVAGPSGIGKSAVLWMAAYVARHAVWYRVHRLREEGVEPIVRLAKAAGAGRYGPVGFIVDGVGTGSLTAWDALLRRAAGTPGLLLLGSVREEDTLPLTTFGECVVVRPRLDEDLAARIHAGLLDSGTTTQPHWREAFSESDGLTLEFTHLLSRGRRLRDVIGDQIRDRVREGRAVELAVIAHVSVADRWGASLAVDRLADAVTATPGDLKTALTRLTEEHVLTVEDGVVRGLHPLRSASLCGAVHEVPPPTLRDTVRNVIGLIEIEHLASFVARAVADDPSLGVDVVEALGDRLVGPVVDLRTTAAALAGLRLADFTLVARRWAAILDKHGVPVPLRPLALDLGMLDSDLVDAFDARLVAAVNDIRHDRQPAESPLRDQLVARITPTALAAMIHAATSVADATALLAPLAGTGLNLAAAPTGAPVRAALREAPLSDVGEAIATGADVSPATGLVLLDAAGGRDMIIDRLQQHHPWLFDVAVVDEGGDIVLRGRVMHVSDRHNPAPEKAIKALAVLGLRCLPDVDRADLSTVLAEGVPLAFNGYELAVSGLLRQYVHSDSAVAWNRARSRFARSLVAAKSTTERLAASLAVLEDTSTFLADLVDAWVTNRGTGQRLTTLNRQREKLLHAIDALAPERAQQPLGGSDDSRGGMLDNDPVHGVAQGIVQNLAPRLSDPSGYAGLAAFAGDTIMQQVNDARNEPWALLGLDAPPPLLDRLATLLRLLATVLAELALGDTTASQVAAATRGIPRGKALARAAHLATARAQRRYEITIEALVVEARSHGIRLDVRSRPHPDPKAVTWPPLATAAIADLTDTSLDAVLVTLSQLLPLFTLPDSSLLVIPAKSGIPLLRYTMCIFASGRVYRASEEAQQWLDELPPNAPFHCSDAVADIIEALRELSALAWLGLHRQSGIEVKGLVEAASARYRDAVQRLEALPRDDVTEALTEDLLVLAERVQNEIHDRAAEGTFAESMACELTGQSNEVAPISALIGLATEWDLDPTVARALLVVETD